MAPSFPFPSLSYGAAIVNAEEVVINQEERFRKMSYHNRYYISTAQGLLAMSLPLAEGRHQKKNLAAVCLYEQDKWTIKHWRTLLSAYGRAPYFEHYAPSLEALFLQGYTSLLAFNTASLGWCLQHLGSHTTISSVSNEATTVPPFIYRYQQENPVLWTPYYQLFADRNKFVPSLSMLDLLMHEGPHAIAYLRKHSASLT